MPPVYDIANLLGIMLITLGSWHAWGAAVAEIIGGALIIVLNLVTALLLRRTEA
jgi:hypothetical protein